MTIFEEVEKVIAELPPLEAASLKSWLNDFQAARRYKQIKAYTMSVRILEKFNKENNNALLN